MNRGSGPGEARVRAAEPADARFIAGLAGRLAEVSGLPWLPAEATGRFAAGGCEQAVAAIGQRDHLVLVAVSEAGERLGFVHTLLDQSVFTGERVGYVSTLVVTGTAVGRGVGRWLMAGAEQWAAEQGCALMTLEVFGGNSVARAVYARLGYQEQTLKLAKPL